MASFKVLVVPVLALLAGAISAPAAAHGSTTAYAAGQGSVNRIEVGIDVHASVSDRCGFATDGAPSGTVSQTEFDRTGFSKDFAIRLNCTSASRIAVSSLNGGLAQGETVTGYASSAPYNVELKMIADNGTNASATCAAALLKSGAGCTFSGSASTSNGLKLGAASTKANGSYLRVSAQPYTDSKPLLAGSYSDTLTITISIAP
ncbi:hypothetical protein [Altererythrobacter sp. Root672]|uniref:hypothetical protein n=1 Tax=Altererythrobacter sp. Root672 TaxID=1736584 RepID=UPI0006F43D9B|nr:hypothetical protein [Altererythrobacter sp. Root672]KRA82694.1 hypothetical protein ASD76_00935 [Altererythrobacter sp. Root672]